MNQYNNQTDLQDIDDVNKTSKETTILYIFYTILAGILTLIPISSLILGLIESIVPGLCIDENIYVFSFYAIKVIGFLIYFLALKKTTKSRIILTGISGAFSLFSILVYASMNNIENTGIDGIGEALALGMLLNICLLVYYISAFILFISYAKKFIFKKKVITSIIISIVSIVLLIFVYKTISHYSSIQRVNEDIPSVNDFKDELVKRKLYIDENLLFGVDSKERNLKKVNFQNNLNEKYPSYIYYGYKTKNISRNFNEKDDYLYWIIYYTNGKIYASLSDYYESSYPNNFHIYSNILSEEKEIYTYNTEENYFDIIKDKNDCLDTDYGIYEDKYMYISIDVLTKSILNYSEHFCEKYEVINRIDSETLDIYANNLKSKN